ncbi:MAG: ATP-binding protein [Methanobacteriota archaeon]
MTPEKLPIGIQSFEKIRTGRYAYVDKTQFISALVRDGSYYFLSRPRRFGKSLFVDTLDCAFSGRKKLFHGLYLLNPEAGWDFEKIYPVLRVDFAGGTIRSATDLTDRLDRLLTRWEEQYGTKKTIGSPGERLLYIIPQIATITGEQVVILIDEYDKPILDNLEKPELATAMREMLKDFYGAIKPLDVHLRFVFLTGVSKFAKTGIFSGLNNLKDITLDRRYSSLCGYTQRDLTTVFGNWIVNCNIQKIAEWYNGYSWTGESVYNPFDILLFLDEKEFKSYWFETGTPSFLIKLLTEKPRSLPDLDTLMAGEELLGSFQIEDLKPETLLFQTGYLTIKGEVRIGEKLIYSVGFPNLEVKSAFSELMLGILTGTAESSMNQMNLDAVLNAGDNDCLREVFHSFFASIPHDWYRKNQISGFEGYYASIVYAYFASLGYIVIPEDTTNKGRIDLTVITTSGIWIFEFKVQDSYQSTDKSPLTQIQDKRYAEKYQADGRPVHEIGIVFDSKTRNIVTWEVGGVTDIRR